MRQLLADNSDTLLKVRDLCNNCFQISGRRGVGLEGMNAII